MSLQKSFFVYLAVAVVGVTSAEQPETPAGGDEAIRERRSFHGSHSSYPPPFPTHLLGLPSFAAALASNSAASHVANSQASAANSAAQVALATAAHKQAKSAMLNRAAQEAQDSAVAEASLAAEANKAAHSAEKTYNKAVEMAKNLAKLSADAQTGITDAWQAMQATKNVASGQEAMAFKAQQTANMLARKQARTLSDLESAQDAVVHAKLAASKAASAASGIRPGGY